MTCNESQQEEKADEEESWEVTAYCRNSPSGSWGLKYTPRKAPSYPIAGVVGSCFRVWGLGFGSWGSGCGVLGLGFRV